MNPAQARQLLAAVTYVRARRRRDRELLTVYAKCLDGQRSLYNDRITQLLGE